MIPRSQIMQRAVLAGALVVAAAVALALTQIPYIEVRTIAVGVSNFDELKERFISLAKIRGAVYAFEVLKRAKLPSNTDLHLLGHAVGDVLYEQKGIDGIADCTQDFRNACSHAIVIGALTEYGTGDTTLRMVDDACNKAPGGLGAYTMCYHGLGHGVFAYFGYDLSKTVAFCKKMGTSAYNDEQYTQCVGGAVMELMGGGGHDHGAWVVARGKYLPPADALAPCSSPIIPQEAKGFCYLYLTPRLFEFAGADVGHPDQSTFPRAFSYCDALPHAEQHLRDECFGGFGKEFVAIAAGRDIRAIDEESDATYALAASWCKRGSARDGSEACIREALGSVFWGGENDVRASFRFCEATPSDLFGPCLHELGKNIARYLRGDQKMAWCKRLPEKERDQCGG